MTMQWYVAMILEINLNVHKILLHGALVIRQNYTFVSV